MISWVVPCLLLASIFLPGTLSLSCIPKVCPHSHKPNYVCGTNGDTYLSECHLARDICVKNILGLHLGKAYSGACKTQYPVRCPQCANEPYSSAVCGSDQVTYSSKCKLEAAKCNTQKYVEVDHLGPCQGSDIGGSHHGGSEIGGSHIGGSQGGSQGGSSHQAHCYQTCSYGGPNVCGSNGRTYLNWCELQKASCHIPGLTVYHQGRCGSHIGGSHIGGSQIGGSHIGGSQGGSQGGSSHQAHCYQTCSYEGPNVCGSNGRTYLNWCELQKASCHIPGLTVHHQGRCDNYGGNQGMGGTGGVSGIVGGPGSVGGQYCHPHVHCAAYGTPVCASDGRKYQNICWLKKAACMNLYLTQVHCRVQSGHGTIGVHSGVHPGLGSTGVHSGVHPGLVGSTGVHPGLGSTGGVHPGLGSTGGVHPGLVSTVVHSGVHPGLVGSTGVHPGLGSTGGVHPGLGSTGGVHPGLVSTGVHSGVHPGLVGSTGGVHPGLGGSTGGVHPGLVGSTGVHTGHGNTGVHGGVHPGLGSTGGVHPGLGSTGGVYPGLVSTGVVHGGVHTGDYLNSPPNLRQKKEEEKKEEKEEEEKEEEEEKYNKETVITFKPKISPNP